MNEAKTKLRKRYDGQKYFYMCVGNEPDYFFALEQFEASMKQISARSVHSRYTVFKDENHASIPYIGMFEGLKFVFSDWQLPNETFGLGLAAIDAHFMEVSVKYKQEVKTPENLVNLLGYTYLQNNDIKNAIRVFSENVERYPESANAWDSLGEAYEKSMNDKEAARNYRKALNLATQQGNRNAAVYRRNLERVSGK